MLTPFPPFFRHQKLIKAIKPPVWRQSRLTLGPSLTYLTGLHFHTSERPVVLLFAPGKRPALVLPSWNC